MNVKDPVVLIAAVSAIMGALVFSFLALEVVFHLG